MMINQNATNDQPINRSSETASGFKFHLALRLLARISLNQSIRFIIQLSTKVTFRLKRDLQSHVPDGRRSVRVSHASFAAMRGRHTQVTVD